MKHQRKGWRQVLPVVLPLAGNALLAALCAYWYVSYLYLHHGLNTLSSGHDSKTFLFISLWLSFFIFAAAIVQFQSLVKYLVSREKVRWRPQSRTRKKAASKKLAADDDNETFQLVSSGVLGTVKWFDATRGYGFITSKEGNDIFVHISDVKEGTAPRQGEKVRYDVANSVRGPKATNIVLEEPDGNVALEEEESLVSRGKTRWRPQNHTRKKATSQKLAADDDNELFQLAADDDNEPFQMAADDDNEPFQMAADDDNEPFQMAADDDNEPVQMAATDDNEPFQMAADDDNEPVQMAADDDNEPFQMAAADNNEPFQLVASGVPGTVKWFDATKGYGFITSKEGKDIFVHISDVKEGTAPRQGVKVRYDVANSARGPKATNIVLEEPNGNVALEEEEEEF